MCESFGFISCEGTLKACAEAHKKLIAFGTSVPKQTPFDTLFGASQGKLVITRSQANKSLPDRRAPAVRASGPPEQNDLFEEFDPGSE